MLTRLVEETTYKPTRRHGYSVIYCRGDDLHDYTLIATGFRSAEEAGRHRLVSGDLVITPEGHIDQSISWLFDWELMPGAEMCWSRRMQRRYANPGSLAIKVDFP